MEHTGTAVFDVVYTFVEGIGYTLYVAIKLAFGAPITAFGERA